MLKASILFPYFFIYKLHFKKAEKDRASTRKFKLTNSKSTKTVNINFIEFDDSCT